MDFDLEAELLAFSLAMFKDCPQHALAIAIKESRRE